MIIIAGDSWGCGEWSQIEGDYSVSHAGLAQYLIDNGHDVLNMSVGGACQQSIILQLQIAKRLISIPLNRTKIFVFQTEWHRHLDTTINPESGWSFTFDQHFVSYQISHWLYQLSRFATTHDVQIGIIGGQIDTIWLDKFEILYPNLYIACQSFVNLCVNHTDRILEPIQALRIDWQQAELLKRGCKSHQDLEFFIDLIEKADRRQELLQQNPHWFRPDGRHGNRLAHKKLYEFINDKKYI